MARRRRPLNHPTRSTDDKDEEAIQETSDQNQSQTFEKTVKEEMDDDHNNVKSSLSATISNNLPVPSLVIAAGTYDGVLAGWEFDFQSSKLAIRFASPVHQGSVRCLSLNTTTINDLPHHHHRPGLLLSVGFDDTLKLHDFLNHVTSSGEIRTPSELGSPTVSALAPPSEATHALIGFASGKLLLYKIKTWNVEHVLPGHSDSSNKNNSSGGGVASIAVHPSGKLALTGGTSDGKLMLWDLTKGRLAHVSKLSSTSRSGGRNLYSAVSCIVWGSLARNRSSDQNSFSDRQQDPDDPDDVYAYCYGSHVTVKDVATGENRLDVELPARVHQIALLCNPHGLFVVCACNDGSLPVLLVTSDTTTTLRASCDDEEDAVVRAIMAIEPVESDSPVAGEERFKCVVAVGPYLVVVANSAGVVSVLNLFGAVHMILSGSDDDDNDDDSSNSSSSETDDEQPDDDDMEMAVEILDGVQLGSGARITCLTAWATGTAVPPCLESSGRNSIALEQEQDVDKAGQDTINRSKAMKLSKNYGMEEKGGYQDKKSQPPKRGHTEVEMDPEALEKARNLVKEAKKIQKTRKEEQTNKQRKQQQ